MDTKQQFQNNNDSLKEDDSLATFHNIEQDTTPLPEITPVTAEVTEPVADTEESTLSAQTTPVNTAQATIHVNNSEAPSPPKSPNFKPTQVFNATTQSLKDISSKLNPVKKQIGKGFYQVRQIAQETFGTAEALTTIPKEYRDLEKRVDTLSHLYSNLLKVTKIYGTPYYDYPVPIQETFLGFTTNVVNRIKQISASSDPIQDETTQNLELETVPEHPKTLSHAVGQVAADGAKEIGEDKILGTALHKYAAASDELGNARVQMDSEINEKFNQSLKSTITASMEKVQKTRRRVEVTRFTLDTLKTKFRELKSGDVTAARQEVESAEEEFIGAIEESTHLMRSLLEDPAPLNDLVNMAQAQLTYFKKAQELFSELVPELTEIRVTQESKYRSSDE